MVGLRQRARARGVLSALSHTHTTHITELHPAPSQGLAGVYKFEAPVPDEEKK